MSTCAEGGTLTPVTGYLERDCWDSDCILTGQHDHCSLHGCCRTSFACNGLANPFARAKQRRSNVEPC